MLPCMGAEGSKGGGPGRDPSAAATREGNTELHAEIRRLQERIRDLEHSTKPPAAPPPDGGGGESWYDVLGREPTLAVVRLSPETCSAVDRLFAVLDVNGDGVLSAADVPTEKKAKDARGRVAKLLQPISDFLVQGELSPAALRRGLARRAAKVVVAPPAGRDDSIAGWVAQAEAAANDWLAASIAAALDSDGGRDPSPPRRRPAALTIYDPAPQSGCAPLTAVALAYSNLGYPCSRDDLFASARLPLWVLHRYKSATGIPYTHR